MKMNAHFIVRDGLYVRTVAFPVFESGYQAITEDDAKALVGGTIYLYQTKAENSYFRAGAHPCSPYSLNRRSVICGHGTA
jgi:hypothetical protein